VHLNSLFCQCLTILSNLSVENEGARKEVMKFKGVGILSEALKLDYFIVTSDIFLDRSSWFLSLVTKKFDLQFISQITPDTIVPYLVKLLYLPDTKQNEEIIENAIDAIINLVEQETES